MDDFAALESELSEAAKIGNIDHVIGLLRDLGNLHHLWKPNPAQVVAIERAAEKCLRRGGSAEVIQPQDLQNPDATPEPATEAVGGERLIKGYMVSSVNEWGADQTRILLLTNEAVHRVKYSFPNNAVVSWHSTPLSAIQRIEYGSFRAGGSSLTTFLWRKEIEDQQGFRVYTLEKDGKRSAADPSGAAAPAAGAEAGAGPAPAEYFREYRALLAEDEPWKEEVFMLEVVAALQAIKTLTRSKFDVRLTRMEKTLPGGLFTLLHNANRRRQHGF